ncbi:MAG: hypothetical protein JWN29_3799 [Acidimicrobiales bacterium]|nr:hypothetical protein [Acidimicrobiales bacterium]
MSDIAFAPAGHPVRRFTVATSVVAALALLAWWTGVLAPRLGVHPSSGTTYNWVTRTGVAFVEVQNHGAFGVRVVGVGGDRDVLVTGAGPVDAHAAPREMIAVEVGAHDTVRLAIAFRFPCPGWAPPDGTHALRLAVRTASGITRHVLKGSLIVGSYPCPDPAG